MAEVAVITKLLGSAAVVSGIGSIGTAIQGVQKVAMTARAALLASAAALRGFGERASRAGTFLTIGLTLPIVAATGAVVALAAAAEESENLFEVAMGDMAKAGREFSEALSSQLGLNAFEVREFNATLFEMTSNMGVSREAAFEMSEGLTQLIFDLASFRNLRFEEAFAKLRSGIVGESEPLKQLGIIVNETTVKTLLLEKGLIDTNTVLTDGQKVIGRYITILERTKSAQGDMARTVTSATNAFRSLKSMAIAVAIDLGTTLLPAMQVLISLARSAVSELEDLSDKFADMTPAMKGLVVALLAVLALMGPIAKALAGLFKLMAGMLTILAALTPSIVALGAALLALAAVTVAVISAWEDVELNLRRIWVTIKVIFLEGVLAVVQFVEVLIKKLFGTVLIFAGIGEAIGKALKDALIEQMELGSISAGEAARNLGVRVIAELKSLPDKIKELLAAPFAALGEIADRELGDFAGLIEGMSELIKKAFEEAGSGIDKAAEKMKKANKALGESIRQSVLTPLEAYNERLALLKKLLDGTFISQETFSRAIKKAKVDYDAALEALKNLDETTQNLKNAMGDAATAISTAFEDAIIEGKALREVLLGLEEDIIRIILRLTVTKPLEKFLGGLIEGFDFGKLLGGGGGAPATTTTVMGAVVPSGLQHGGPVVPGRPFIVGERGPELFVPSRRGRVIPNNEFGGSITVNFNVTTPDAGSFRASEGQIAVQIGRLVSRASRRLS